MKKIPLVIRVLIAIILGIVLGLFLPEGAVRIFATFNSIFSNLLGFIIPLLIVGLIAPAIAELGKGGGQAGGHHRRPGLSVHPARRLLLLGCQHGGVPALAGRNGRDLSGRS